MEEEPHPDAIVELLSVQESKPTFQKLSTDCLENMLGVAIQFDQVKDVKKLLDQGVSSNCVISHEDRYEKWVTALGQAARYNACKSAKLLLERGARVDGIVLFKKRSSVDGEFRVKPMDGGRSPLYEAAENGSLQVLDLLLPYSSKLNTPRVTNTFGIETPVTAAVRNGYAQVVSKLLHKGAEAEVWMRLQIKNRYEYVSSVGFALFKSITESSYNVEIFNMLLAKWLDSAQRAARNPAQIIKAFVKRFNENSMLSIENMPEKVRKIVGAYFHPMRQKNDRVTNLPSDRSDENEKEIEQEYSKARGKVEGSLCKLIVDYEALDRFDFKEYDYGQLCDAHKWIGNGVNPNCIMFNNWGSFFRIGPFTEFPALEYAVFKGALETAKELIKKGADVNAQNTDGFDFGRHDSEKGRHTGYTALMRAVLMNNPTVVKLMLQAGADKKIKCTMGKVYGKFSPLYYAWKGYRREKGSEEARAVLKLLLCDANDIEYIAPTCMALKKNDWHKDVRKKIANVLLEDAVDIIMDKAIKINGLWIANETEQANLRALIKEAALDMIYNLIKHKDPCF